VSNSRVAVDEARGEFGNPEEVERAPLKAVTRALANTITENAYVCNSDMYGVGTR
jgi:hypothetical protein